MALNPPSGLAGGTTRTRGGLAAIRPLPPAAPREPAALVPAVPARKQTVFGYYDHNNVGDEAFKAVFQNLFGAGNVEFIGNMERAGRTDQVVFGGGAVINTYFINQLKNVDSIYCVGCSLPFSRGDIKVIEPLRDRFKCFYLRSRDDVAALEEAGIHAVYTPDIVFTLKPPEIAFAPSDFAKYANLPPIDFGHKKHTVIAFLSDDYTIVYSEERQKAFLKVEKLKNELAAAFDMLAEKCNVVFIPLSVWYGSRDYVFALDVVRRMRNMSKVCVVERYLEPMDVLGAVNALDATVVSMKFHGLVFGLMTGKLVVNIGTTRKNQSLMRDAGLTGLSFSYETVSARGIADSVAKHVEPRLRDKIAVLGREFATEAAARLAEFKASLPD
jgi:polysaccharide pyruvyl transferase WcaK-like protein